MLRRRLIPLAAILVVDAHSASACPMALGLNPANVIQADVAMIGRIEGYDFRGRDSAKVAHAVLTVQPILPLRGLLLSEQLIYWENSTFDVPKEWKTGQIVFVAARKIDPEFRQLRGSIHDQSGNDLQLEVLQPPCRSPFILEAHSIPSVVASVLVLATWMLPIILTVAAVRFVFIRMRRRLGQ